MRLSFEKLATFVKDEDRIFDIGGTNSTEELFRIAGLNHYEHLCLPTDIRSEKIPVPKDSYDVVISWETIEHLWVIDRHTGNLSWNGIINFWTEAERVLRPGGYFFLTTPNRYCPRTLRTYFLNLVPQIYPPQIGPQGILGGHTSELSGRDLRMIAQATGTFTDIEVTSKDCYSHMYDIPYSDDQFVKWVGHFADLLGRVPYNEELHDTLFFVARKTWKQ